jgi:hypothetical protein
VSVGIAQLFLNLGTRRGVWSASRPGHFTAGKDPVPIVQEAEWPREQKTITEYNLLEQLGETKLNVFIRHFTK